ncbi:MAG TPA: response regulator transcription factor [Actinomycetes bacterium]|nr:response regulator transcription factor [Actinomycetes bacterium]
MTPPIRVAVVDDHPVVREGLVTILVRSASCEVVAEASSGAEALERFPAAEPDVVLVDLKLPDSTGMALIDRLCRLLPDAKLVVITAYEEAGLVREALRLGARGYLLKDSSAEALVAAVRSVSMGQRVVDPALAGRVVELEAVPGSLTGRQREVLRLLAEGRTNREIARILEVSDDTVKFHLKNLFERLGVDNRTEAVVMASRLGHLRLEP